MFSLNPDKIEVILLGTRQQLAKLREFQLNVAGFSLGKKDVVRDFIYG
jgi:hypothetical protein